MWLPRDGRDAFEAFVAAVGSLGLDAQPVDDDRGSDLIIRLPDGRDIFVQVKTASLVTADSAPGQLRRWSKSNRADVVPVVAADRITADGRDRLNQAG